MAIDAIPYWAKVIKHFEANGYIQNGLTIPFIIGARKHIEPKEELLTIQEWLDEVKNYPTPIKIMECDRIKEFVIGELESESLKYMQKVPDAYRCYNNLVFTDDSFIGKNYAEIINELKERYADTITTFNYSKNEGEWGDFTSTEKKRLLEIEI